LKIINIDTNKIKNWDSFHLIFKNTFGFPDYYGENMNAWIDCMTYIDDPESGMTKINIYSGDILIIKLVNSEYFKKNCKEQYLALLECSAFVNQRRLDDESNTMIAIASY
jgi:hypothetical protein